MSGADLNVGWAKQKDKRLWTKGGPWTLGFSPVIESTGACVGLSLYVFWLLLCMNQFYSNCLKRPLNNWALRYLGNIPLAFKGIHRDATGISNRNRHEFTLTHQQYHWLQKANGTWRGCWTNDNFFSCHHITFDVLSVTLVKLLPSHVSKSWIHWLDPIARAFPLICHSSSPHTNQNVRANSISCYFLVRLNIYGFYWFQPCSSLVVCLKIMFWLCLRDSLHTCSIKRIFSWL